MENVGIIRTSNVNALTDWKMHEKFEPTSGLVIVPNANEISKKMAKVKFKTIDC